MIRRRDRAERRRIVTLVSVIATTVTLAACDGTDDGAVRSEPLRVAAASDLMPVFTELGEDFAAETGETVVFSFGSSGQLAQQLIEGAPMDLYLAANVAFVERVLDEGVGDPATQMTYAQGRLALWATEAVWGGWDDGGRDDLDPDATGGSGRWVLVDETLHEPLQQDLVITTSDPRRAALAQRFIDHLTGPRGRDVLERFGLLAEGG